VLDIIIPFNGDIKSLDVTIDSINKNTMVNYGVVVVNESKDKDVIEHLDTIETYRSYVRTIHTGYNRGFFSACNLGAANSKNEYIVFLQPSCYLTKNWGRYLITHFNDSFKCGMIAPGQEIEEGLSHDEIEKIKRYGRPTKGSIEKFCMMTSRKTWEDVGSFNELLFHNSIESVVEWTSRKDLSSYIANNVYIHHWRDCES